MNQQFVHVIMFNENNDLKFGDWHCCFVGVLLCSCLLLWVPQENLSWCCVLNISHKVTSAVTWRL